MIRKSYGSQFNQNVIEDLIKIKDDIKEEIESENPDKKKLTEMEMKYLMRGLELQNNLFYNNRRNIPW